MLHFCSIRLVRPKLCKAVNKRVFVQDMVSIHTFITPVTFMYFAILFDMCTYIQGLTHTHTHTQKKKKRL
jgi:Fe-S-cluster containining protein